MAGHVFVTRGDLTKLACDAWLLPTDVCLQVEPSWLAAAPASIQARVCEQVRLTVPLPVGWGNRGVRVRRLHEWADRPSAPQPWLVNVGAWPGMPAGWYVEGVRQFLNAVASDPDARRPIHGRAKRLIALPLVGGGEGGATAIRGEVARALLGPLREDAARYDLDIALVTFHEQSFAAAQAARKNGGEADKNEGWGELDGLRCHARRLAGHAATGKLVLFLGAGLSKAAGLPDWDGLLWKLAAEAGLGADHKALAALNVLDRAQIIAGRLSHKEPSLGARIAAKMKGNRYALGHALLASLPVDEAATTNYDTLFETASVAAGRPVAVLPYEAALGKSRWLLKLHGCVNRAEDIVLTREDYLRYADRRAALAGIVQALLITRHMLFVGFSLTDDNFHRMADAVRKAVRSPSPAPSTGQFGTALVLSRNPLWQEFWHGDLESVCMARAGDTAADAARRLEIFLDYLVAQATSGAPHLLDQDFDGALTQEERTLREALRTFKESVPDSARSSPAWDRVAALLRDFGDRADDLNPAKPNPDLARCSGQVE